MGQEMIQDVHQTPGDGIDHPWLARFSSLGKRAVWELKEEVYHRPIFEGAEFSSEAEKLAASPKDWRDLVSGGSVFREFLSHRFSSGAFSSWEKAMEWLAT
ncbi:hypothetical protein LCGC14_1258960 [marine sediment metagenome]|uniref:Uncharacterized protein n=1 Tax=marine sediment metagenome TaxID=412755 RepID=A0A0F9LMM4_9ZZZZ